MSIITVVSAIEPYEGGGFALRVKSVDSQQAWWKWHETEQNAYVDAVDLGVAAMEIIEEQGVLATIRRRLKVDTSIAVERLELFGLKKIT